MTASDNRWLVIGLGNPEGEYGGTRHNVGADCVRVLASRFAVPLSRNKRVRCEAADIRVGDQRLTLGLPSVYMNESGGPTQAAMRWLKVGVDNLIVIHDDLDLEVGALRLKRGGGHGGHNGLRDIDRAAGSREYYRVRIGIGRPPGRQDPKDHVLRRFAAKDRDLVDVAIAEAADAVESLVTVGLEPTQNRFHTAKPA